jgi:hypothetical protein
MRSVVVSMLPSLGDLSKSGTPYSLSVKQSPSARQKRLPAPRIPRCAIWSSIRPDAGYGTVEFGDHYPLPKAGGANE